MKKHLSLVLILCLVISCFGTFTTFADSTEDIAYNEAFRLLSAIDAVSGGENFNKNDKITRGEIAEAVSAIMGLSSISTVTNNNNEYLGYTNEDTFEQEWQWIADAPSTDESVETVNPMENATPFYDVTTLHKNWNAINKVASLGIMNGSGDGYFRPDDYATVNEIAAVCVKILGAEMLTEKNYPIGYTMVAGSEGITDGIKATDYSSLISKRDFYVMLCNTVTSQYYKVFGYGEMYTVHKTNEMLLSATHDIYKTTGIVNANERTYLDSNAKVGKGKIEIDGVIYDCPDYDTNAILGHNVSAYYKLTDMMEIPKVVLIMDTKTNTLTIPAEKIASFKNYKYTYTDENDKTQVEKISADIDVIYNEQALTSFSNADLKPTNGSVTLIDNDEDGKWDVLKIESFRIMFVSSTDTLGEIVYGTNADFKELNLHGCKYDIYDREGSAVLISNIRNRDTIAVKENLTVQGREYYYIQIVTTVVTGTVEAITFDDIYTISGIDYEISKECLVSINIGDYGTFYLDNHGRIYNYEKQIKSGLDYGYVVAADVDSMGDVYRLRLFLMDGTFANYTLNKKVNLNKDIISKASAFNTFVDAYGNVQNQLILFSADENMMINEVQTSGVFEDGLQKKDGVGGSYSYRKNGCFLLNNATVSFWKTDATPYISIPAAEERWNEEKYMINPEPQNDMSYKISEAYVTNKDSIVSTVLIQVLEANQSTETEDRDFGYHGNVVPAMVAKKTRALNDKGEICYSITTVNYNGEKTYTTNDNKLDSYIADIERGDIIQIKTTNGYISSIRKVYDVGTRLMRDKTALNSEEKYGAQGVGTDFLRANTLIQGFAAMPAYDDGYFVMNWAEYENNALIGASATQELSIKSSEMSFIIFDTSKNAEPYLGSADDLVYEHDGILGDEILVHHAWATGRTVYIIK